MKEKLGRRRVEEEVGRGREGGGGGGDCRECTAECDTPWPQSPPTSRTLSTSPSFSLYSAHRSHVKRGTAFEGVGEVRGEKATIDLEFSRVKKKGGSDVLNRDLLDGFMGRTEIKL